MNGTLQVLTLNAGSSSLKAAVYRIDDTERLLAAAQVARIGLAQGTIRFSDAAAGTTTASDLAVRDHAHALQSVFDWLDRHPALRHVDAVAHRVVHGGDFTDPRLVTPEVVEALRRLLPVDPDHLPQAIAAIEAVARARPDVPQVACFDTAFHRGLPPVARLYPLPLRFAKAGVRRYGFHGLSCEYIVAALHDLDAAAAGGRLIVAHLGNGASMTAVNGGASVETTMGFSPAGGLMMGTRTGDLDPGVLLYALREQRLTAADLNALVNKGAGLLGVSGSSPDMHDLLEREATDDRAAAAVDLFCHQAKKSLGALVAVLGGLETLVFTGGIGEHSAQVRERIVRGLEPFGILLDRGSNGANAPIISPPGTRVVVRVMKTDEDLVLARHARRVLTAEGRTRE